LPVCFVDQGDGTTRDVCFGLQWERKTGADGTPNPTDLHDVDNRYVWAGRCSIGGGFCQPNDAAASTCQAQTGGASGCATCGAGETCNVASTAVTTVWDWINLVNAEPGFAGHADWRLPSEAGQNVPAGALELETIRNCGFGNPCVDPAFGPTGSSYWSRTFNTDPAKPDTAWVVDFSAGAASPARPELEDGAFFVRAVRAPSTLIRDLVIDPTNPTTLYASGGARPGVYKTVDGGASWQLSLDLQGFFPSELPLAFGPPPERPVYAALFSQGAGPDESVLVILRKPDADPAWDTNGEDLRLAYPDFGGCGSGARGTNVALLPGDLAADPLDPTIAYLGTEKCGVYKRSSTDGGPSWSLMNTGLVPGTPPKTFAVSTDPGLVYAGFSRDTLSLAGQGVFKSTDGAMNWSAANLTTTICGFDFIPDVLALALQKTGMTTTVYAGTDAGIFKTTDGGATWSPINTGLPTTRCSLEGTERFPRLIRQLAVDPTDANVAYAVADAADDDLVVRLFKTEDGGVSWTVKLAFGGPDLEGITSLAIDAIHPTTVYAGTGLSGVLKTTDGGDHWTRMNTGLAASN